MQAEGENEVNNELANRISLFYADATPMLKTLSDGTTKFVSEVRNASLPVKISNIDPTALSIRCGEDKMIQKGILLYHRTRTCLLRTQQMC